MEMDDPGAHPYPENHIMVSIHPLDEIRVSSRGGLENGCGLHAQACEQQGLCGRCMGEERSNQSRRVPGSHGRLLDHPGQKETRQNKLNIWLRL